jgi:FlaA1/EpsC-like NDP-sugar epimerase
MGEALVERLRSVRGPALMLFDAVVLLGSYLVFALVRYESTFTAEVPRGALAMGVAAVVAQWFIGTLVRLYQGRVTVASLEETLLLGLVTVAAGFSVTVLNILLDPQMIARSVPPGATFMAVFAMVLGRAIWRAQLQRQGIRVPGDATPALVFGAGEAGVQLVRSMHVSGDSDLRPVGLLDDDPWRRRLRVQGVRVLGGREDIAKAAEQTGAEVLVIAIPSASAALIRDVSARARGLDLSVKVLPGVHELLGDSVSVRDVRDIDVRDLLGRAAIETDVPSIAGYITGRRVLVTGAGGSIGSELCRQLHRFAPAELAMLDRDESGLHSTQLSLHGKALLDSPEVVLADIRDRAAIERIFLERRPDVVFHAAALKHLPMLEQYPAEALKTNVLGTMNVLQASAMVGVERFVNISTDKAADPTSVLGYSKRVAERLTAAVAADTPGSFLSVRFGNVLGSRGSVLTSFTAQIAAGGPVTVTHPEVTRYFMTVQEAVQLVIQAAAIGDDGEVLILDMGEPVRILDVAKQLIDQSGAAIDIAFTGLREGEKLHERLYSDGEAGERRVHPLVSHVSAPALRLSRVRPTQVDVNPDKVVEQLQDWCAVEETADLDVVPGPWSGTDG